MRLFAVLGLALVPAMLLAQSGGGSPPPSSGPAVHHVPERLTACQACHGVDGIATLPIAPNLAGQRANYLEAQLRAFREGSRKSDFMNPIAAQLSDAEIGELAAYFGGLPAAGSLSAEQRRAGAVPSKISLAADFPRGFSQYGRSEDAAGGTITTSYASQVALAAAGRGQPLGPGSAIVVETRVAARDAQGNLQRSADGSLVAGAVRSYSISAAFAGWGAEVPATLRNGDWHYGQLSAERKLLTTNQANCLACHRAMEKTSFVFGLDAIEKRAKARVESK